jgi:hypothetical protein
MRKFVLCLLCLHALSALAQFAPKPTPGTKAIEGMSLPPGTIVVLPATDAAGNKRPFQIPKEWLEQRPTGAPVGKDWPNIAITQAPKGVSPSDKHDDLVAKQTAAITFLSARIDKLESRLKELEQKAGPKQ